MTLFLRRSSIRIGHLAIGSLWVLSTLLPAQASTLLAAKGQVQIERNQKIVLASIGSVLREADTLMVEPDGEALVQFRDGAKILLRSNSRVNFEQLVQAGEFKNRKKTLKILKGGMRYVSAKVARQSNVVFVTRNVSVGIRGTDIEIVVAEDSQAGNPPGTYLKVNTGQAVLVGQDGTRVEVEPGQVAFGSEPELTPRGAVGVRRPAARRIESASPGVFRSGALDSLL
ncbi:MAG: FecR domain-containing protein [Polaromonas sp.]|nr:FecR domain-containing protein [Polaromonas sp.]